MVIAVVEFLVWHITVGDAAVRHPVLFTRVVVPRLRLAVDAVPPLVTHFQVRGIEEGGADEIVLAVVEVAVIVDAHRAARPRVLGGIVESHQLPVGVLGADGCGHHHAVVPHTADIVVDDKGQGGGARG